MATLRQDVWFGEIPRLSALRLGPFRHSEARVVMHPHRAASSSHAEWAAFLERLAERVEVILIHPRPAEDPAGAVSLWRDDFLRVLEGIAQRWGDGKPLVVGGVGLGGALALSLADQPVVRAAVALAPLTSSQAPWPGGPDASFDPVELDKPVLIVAPRDEPRLERARLEAAAKRWSAAVWIAPPGGAAAALAPAWASALAEWVLAATRS